MPAISNKPAPKTTPTPESEETEETDEVTDQDVAPTPVTTEITKKSKKIEIKADKDELKLQFVDNQGTHQNCADRLRDRHWSISSSWI